MVMDIQVSATRRQLEVSGVEVEQCAALEQREEGRSERATEIQQQLGTFDKPADVLLIGAERFTRVERLQIKIAAEQQNCAVATQIVNRQAFKKVTNDLKVSFAVTS